jgi:hypothetical protein
MAKFAFASAFVAALALTVTATPLENVKRQDLAATSTTSSSPTVAPSPSPEQIRALKDALTAASSEADRQAILLPNPPDASNITFTFSNNSVQAPTGGTVQVGGVDAFPALIGTNVAQAFGWINPCGLNVPHLHPRANEWLTVILGELVGGLVLELNPGGTGNLNGTNPTGPIPQVNATLTPFKGMLFPQGQVHYQFNPTCEPAVFTAAFDNRDPGRTQIARNFFSIVPDEVLITAAGGNLELLDAARIDQLREVIPSAFAEQMTECAKRCGIPTA